MSRFYFNQKGSVLLLMAFTIPFLIAISAIAADVGYLYVQRSHMQNIADAAALAGAARLGTSNAAAQELAELYIEKNSNASDVNNREIITFSEEGSSKKIRVDITRQSPLLFLEYLQKYFAFPPVDLAVYAVASHSGSAPGIFGHSIISGSDGTFYLLGEWGSSNNTFNDPIYVNGKFQFDRNSENGTGSDALWPSNKINDSVTIATEFYNIGGLNKPVNKEAFESRFTFGADKIDITENNPAIKAKIDSLTNKANTFSSFHPAYAPGGNTSAIDALKLTSPLYVEGNLGSGYSAKNIISGQYGNGGTVNNDIVIVATGDISLSLSDGNLTFSNTATITLISLNGNIQLNGLNNKSARNLNILAPHGSIKIVGGGPTTIDGYLIGQSIILGQGSITYQNAKSENGGGGGGKVRLIE